jgi:flagellar FliL protein
MAEKKDSGAKVEAAAEAKGGKKKLFIIIGAVSFLLLAGGGGATFWMLGKKKDAEAAAAAQADADDGAKGSDTGKTGKKKAKGDKKNEKPVFIEADPFTVNLADAEPQRMAQFKLVLALDNDKAAEDVKTMMPVVRNNILLLLSSKTAADLASRQGKEKLATEVIETSNQALEGTPAADQVKNVLFQQIIVQ